MPRRLRQGSGFVEVGLLGISALSPSAPKDGENREHSYIWEPVGQWRVYRSNLRTPRLTPILAIYALASLDLTIDVRDAVGDRLHISDSEFTKDGTTFDIGHAGRLE